MEEVTLYEYDTKSLYILLKVYFNASDQLIFEGLDCGSRVRELMGDFDYEYTLTIEPDQADRLCAVLGVIPGDKQALLQAIKERFTGEDAYSRFGDFLRDAHIKCRAFSWV